MGKIPSTSHQKGRNGTWRHGEEERGGRGIWQNQEILYSWTAGRKWQIDRMENCGRRRGKIFSLRPRRGYV